MTEEEHQLLVEIHTRVGKLPTKTELGQAKRSIIKTVVTNRKPQEELNGPLSRQREQQVHDVKVILYKAYEEGKSMTLHAACLQAWEPIEGGYPTPKSLYEYCHSHEDMF